MIELSILIPARNEEFLNRTIQDALENIEAQTEIIVVLDGYLPNPALTVNDDRITLIYNPVAHGQRGATNQAAKLAKGKYVMKSDAHLAYDKGFDRKMIEAYKSLPDGDNVTMIPVMKNLHVFDWVCPEGHRFYQGKNDVCETCGKKMIKDIVWQVKPSPSRFTFMFDKTLHFQYWGELAKRATGDLRETLSIQGSCFMLTKERYFALDISSETDFHSWGQQGVEVACKTWLSGGRVLANLNTWYAHLFRTNNFGGFPYENPQSLVDDNRERSRELFQRNKWPLAIHTFEWLLDRFYPVPEWHDALKKGIIYYTDSLLDEKIAIPVREQLIKCAFWKDMTIVSSSLKKLDFGSKNTHFPSLKRSPETMFKEILAALEKSTADIIFFTEHDVLYHPSHFDFLPPDKNIFYFNNNVWKIDAKTKKGVKVDTCEQLSGVCVYKETALAFVREKLKQIQAEGFDRHYEPQSTVRGGWMSAEPNVDIRHDTNLTPSRWSKEEFKNQDNTIGWTEGECPEWAKDLF